LHFQLFPTADSVTGSGRLIAFGGKGYAWEKHKKKRRGEEELEEEPAVEGDEVEEEEEDDDGVALGSPARRLKKKKKWRKKVQMFGDTWSFDLDSRSWEEVQLPWDLFDAWGNSPAPRWKPSSAALQNSSGIVLFGGCKTTNVAGVMNDLWVFSPESCCPAHGRWRNVQTWNTPRPRRGHVAVAFEHRLIVYGGKGYDVEAVHGGHSECLTDLWVLENVQWHGKAEMAWTRGPDFPSGCRWGGTGSKIKGPSGREYLALFGGRNLNPNFVEHTASESAYTYYNELWLYDPEMKQWFQRKPSGPLPHPRDHHGACMVDGDLYIFGGRISEKRTADAVVGDTWSYSLATDRWTQHRSVDGVGPGARYMPGVSRVTWKGADALAVFAGETLPGSTKKTTLNDVWVFETGRGTSTPTWTKLFEADCSRAKLDEAAPPTSPSTQLTLAAEAATCLLAGAMIVGLGWKVLTSKCRPSAARCRRLAEPDCVSGYEYMG